MLNYQELQSIFSTRLAYKGLGASEAEARIKKYGENMGPPIKRRGIFGSLWRIFTEPMMLLIITAAGVYFFVGEKAETLIFLLSVIPIGLMEFFQEKRTDEAILELDKVLVENCKAYRDGILVDLEIKKLVPGDLVYLTAGDKIPADGYLFSSPGLLVDESILTGESMPRIKYETPENLKKSNEDNKINQGTLVVQGEGTLLVEKTGAETAYGKLGNLLQKITSQETPLQKKIHKLVRFVAIFAIIVALGGGLSVAFHRGWLAGFVGALTIAMSLIPEEFPVVFSVFLIMGVWRMARQKAFVREMAMVETLGSATVICVDKTGTLTEGRMSLEKIYYKNNIFNTKNVKKNNADVLEFINTAILALERVARDPIEIEAQRFAENMGVDLEDFYNSHKLLVNTSFNAQSKMVHHLWQDQSGVCFQYSAGAPESILEMCPKAEKEKIEEVYRTLAKEGHRLVAVAKRHCPCEVDIKTDEMEFVGLMALTDPPRTGVKESISVCQDAGIKVIMITGDNPLTAHHIAEAVGIKHNEEIILGSDVEKMSAAALSEAVRRHNIFARVRPDQKYAIVEALQHNGEVVAMTGDGVNDAPALRKADIGVAMGKRGTEVARAAAGIILLDDNFSTIVEAVKEGRRIYANMREAFAFLFSFHLPIVGLVMLPLLFGQPLIFYPIHIIFLELICDPASVLGFEREKARRGIMKEDPRSPKEPLINPKLWGRIVVHGLSILAVSFGFYLYFGIAHGDHDLGSTLAFVSLVISQIFLILLNREWEQVKSNKLLLIISFLTVSTLIVFLFTPGIRNLLHLTTISAELFLRVLGVSLLSMALAVLLTTKKDILVNLFKRDA